MEESQKFLLTVVVVVVIVAAIGGGLYWERTKLNAARAELAAKQQEEAKLRQVIDKEIPRLRQELQSKAEKVDAYEKTLPNAKDIEAMDETLNKYKDEAGVKLVERRPVQDAGSQAAKGEQPLYNKYSYRLTLAGDFFSWATFVNLLENHERFIRVDEFDAKPLPREPGVLDITMKISTFIYAKAEQPKVATAPAAPPAAETTTPTPAGPAPAPSASGAAAAPREGGQP